MVTMINNYWRSSWCFDGGWNTTIKIAKCPPSTIISIPLGRCWQQDKSYWSMLRSPLPWKWCWPDNLILMWDTLRFVFFDSHLCRVLVLWAVDVLGADVVFVHVAHHLLPLRLSQADAQRAECVKDDLNWGSVNFSNNKYVSSRKRIKMKSLPGRTRGARLLDWSTAPRERKPPFESEKSRHDNWFLLALKIPWVSMALCCRRNVCLSWEGGAWSASPPSPASLQFQTHPTTPFFFCLSAKPAKKRTW